MVLGELSVPERLTICPTALAVGAGYLDILLSSINILLYLPLDWRRPDILSQRAAKPLNNQPIMDNLLVQTENPRITITYLIISDCLGRFLSKAAKQFIS